LDPAAAVFPRFRFSHRLLPCAAHARVNVGLSLQCVEGMGEPEADFA
jgi:hypothetical protein